MPSARQDSIVHVCPDPVSATSGRQDIDGVYRGGAYLRRCLFENSPFFGNPLFIIYVITGCDHGVYKVRKDHRMLEKPLITLKDLNVIQEGYNISSNIVLFAPVAHETPWDNCPEYLYLNEYMLAVRVRILFDFGVAEALQAFNISPACVVSYS
ncbi:hypothetical protein ACLOJK_038224 [Asimina triloba]